MPASPVSAKNRSSLLRLDRLNQAAIQSAGPRYSPGMNPDAPNMTIDYLVDAFDALSLVEGWGQRALDNAAAIEKAIESTSTLLPRVFRRRRMTPASLATKCRELAVMHNPLEIKTGARQLRRDCDRVFEKLEEESDRLRSERRVLPEDPEHGDSRSRLDSDIRTIDVLTGSIDSLRDYLRGDPGQLLCDHNTLLLLGSWGTGKTHLLCDIAKKRTTGGNPALLVLASSLPTGDNLLDSVASTTGIAKSGALLLERLNQLGRATKTRALLIIDAINEGDRETWRSQLPAMARVVANFSHVALVVSCRRPFDDGLVTSEARKRMVTVEHRGFEDQEFDAQLEFFSFYNLPAPAVPLLTPEFTRPLFLKILCEGLNDLGKRSQKRKLREVASGQKGMTYVLEFYVRKVGESIEQDFGLPSKACWIAIKGKSTHDGLAGKMAERSDGWLSTDDAISSLSESLTLSWTEAEHLLRRFITDGLLAEEIRWLDAGRKTGVQFSYQRFGDHLIARHLLDAYLKPQSRASVDSIRRRFYANRPLGRPFQTDRWSRQFESPGIAAAIMLEFPERMKNSVLPHELVSYLPRARQLADPVKDAFLEGLYWRSKDAFTPETDNIVGFFLNRSDSWTRNETFEVLVGLATRPGHPYDASRLRGQLALQSMPQRDRSWSEFLRWSDPQQNAHRMMAWVEQSAGSDDEGVRNDIQLLSLFLTTTDRSLRDRATRALVLRGEASPELFFDEVLDSLAFNDPYVPERMLAAAYGIAMRRWADPRGDALRQAIVPFARALVRQMFVYGAPHATRHSLTRDYALGVIAIARRIYPGAIATRQVPLLRRPFLQLPDPFVDPSLISDEDVEDARRAMHMDFANYTLGRLVPDRGNYQDDHVEYREVRRQIARRMIDLGYSSSIFKKADEAIARAHPVSRSEDRGKIDRYGKKYSWIAYFEMYGLREDLGLLDREESENRSSDCDIDPSFPVPPPTWSPALPNVFDGSPTSLPDWLRKGSVPDYGALLQVDQIDGVADGPWVLLNGFIDQDGSHRREVFTFLRGLLIRPQDVQELQCYVAESQYLGNHQIPEAFEDYYTYGGEIPWSSRFGSPLRPARGQPRRHLSPAMHWFSSGCWRSHKVAEVPIHRWNWESHHSAMNNVSGITFPAPSLCSSLGLVNHGESLDLWQPSGRQATVYRELDVGKDASGSHLLYLRTDLLKAYLVETNQVLAHILWGERNLDHREFDRRPISADHEAAFQSRDNTFGQLVEFK